MGVEAPVSLIAQSDWPGYDDDWLGWRGVLVRIEDAFYDALVDFAYALGELS